MEYNHYGIVVDSEVPIIGVILANVPEWLQKDLLSSMTIDVAYEEHLETCPLDDHCDCEVSSDCYLIGFDIIDQGEYTIDTDAEYSAIVGDTYCFIHASKWVQKCALCSPCFPGQGDLDSTGEFLAYTLPPEVWGDNKPEVITCCCADIATNQLTI